MTAVGLGEEIPGGLELLADLLLERAIGGWRGLIDSGVPTGVFVTAYIVTGQALWQELKLSSQLGVTRGQFDTTEVRKVFPRASSDRASSDRA